MRVVAVPTEVGAIVTVLKGWEKGLDKLETS